MVRHLEEVGTQQPCSPEETLLRGPFHVPGQEDGAPPVAQPHHDRVVVSGPARARAAPRPARRVEHFEPHPAEPLRDAAARSQDGCAGVPRRPLHRCDPGVLSRRADPDGVGTEHRDDRRHPAEVIAVRVGDHDEIEPQHSEGAQGRRHDAGSRIEVTAKEPAGIDQDRSAFGKPHENRVPLADIEGNNLEAPVGSRRPAADGDCRDEPKKEQPGKGAAAAGRKNPGRGGEQRQERDHPPRRRLDEEGRPRQVRGNPGAPGQKSDERRRRGHKPSGPIGPEDRQRRRDRGEPETDRRERDRGEIRDEPGQRDGVEMPGGQGSGRDQRRKRGPQRQGGVAAQPSQHACGPATAGPLDRAAHRRLFRLACRVGAGTCQQKSRRRRVAELEAGVEQPGRLRREEDHRGGREGSERGGPPRRLAGREQEQDHQRRARDRSAGPGDPRIEEHHPGESGAAERGLAHADLEEDGRRPGHECDVEPRQRQDVVHAGPFQPILQVGGERLAFAQEERQEEQGGRPMRLRGRRQTLRQPPAQPRARVAEEGLAPERLHEPRALDRTRQVEVARPERGRVVEGPGVPPGARPADPGGRLDALPDAPGRRPLGCDRDGEPESRAGR